MQQGAGLGAMLDEELFCANKKLGIRCSFVDNNCYKYPVYLKIASAPAKRLVFRGLF